MTHMRRHRQQKGKTMDALQAAVSKPRKFGKKLAKAGHQAALQMLVQELQEAEDHAHRLGVHVTAHAINRAKNALGWEIAGKPEQAAKAALGVR